MRIRVLFLLTFLGTAALAQNPDTTGAAAEPGGAFNNPNPLTTLASQFFEHDYVNFFASASGVVDFNVPIETASGPGHEVSPGYAFSGGVSLNHMWTDSEISLSYSGGYSFYQNSSYNNGTTQYLNLSYAKRLSRRVSMNVGLTGGVILYGTTAYITQPSPSGIIVTNPFSNETRYAGASVGFNVMQTRRLSYGIYGSYFLTRYTYPGSIGSSGLSGGASVNYRLSARTTISAVYGHSYFQYQRNAGNDSADQVGGNISHTFGGHWTAAAYGGVGRSEAVGTVAVPVTLILGNGQAVGGYAIGQYKQNTTFPAYSGSVSRSLKHSMFSISGGEGLAGAGNGYFLSSKSLYLTGLYSFSVLRQNISMAGTVTRLNSISNTVNTNYDSAIFSVSYGHTLPRLRFIGMFLRYDYIQYGALRPFSGVDDNRISFGFSFSSRSIPITLF